MITPPPYSSISKRLSKSHFFQRTKFFFFFLPQFLKLQNFLSCIFKDIELDFLLIGFLQKIYI
jgi:hypothetical protein